jgi:uncharacterized protein (DUF2235 family)
VNRADRKSGEQQEKVSQFFALADDFKVTMTRVECQPWFVGVWDTVNSVGWVENPLKLPFTANNPDIRVGRHAVSIDERRAFFRNHLWRRPADPNKKWGPQDVKQVWFPGVHCDVGGGYPEAQSGLSKIALEWMLQEAKAQGLLVNAKREQEVLGRGGSRKYTAVPDPNAPAHESLKGWWNLAELIPKRHYDWAKDRWERRMNLWRRRTIPPGSLVHESAWQRGGDYASRLPKDVVKVSTVRDTTA